MEVKTVTFAEHFGELMKGFPEATGDQPKLMEAAFFAVAKTVLDMQDHVLRDLRAGRLSYEDGARITHA